MQRKTIALLTVLLTGAFAPVAFAQDDETSDYGGGTTSTQQSTPTTTTGTTDDQQTEDDTATAPASSGTPDPANAASQSPNRTNELAYTGSDAWKGILAGVALLALAAVVVVPRRRTNN